MGEDSAAMNARECLGEICEVAMSIYTLVGFEFESWLTKSRELIFPQCLWLLEIKGSVSVSYKMNRERILFIEGRNILGNFVMTHCQLAKFSRKQDGSIFLSVNAH